MRAQPIQIDLRFKQPAKNDPKNLLTQKNFDCPQQIFAPTNILNRNKILTPKSDSETWFQYFMILSLYYAVLFKV